MSMNRSSTVVFVCVLVAFAALAAHPEPAAARRCPVTPPPRGLKGLPRGAGQFSPSQFDYGTRRLRVELWPHARLPAGILPDGGSYARILPDGSIWAKVGWWRGLPGRLRITGRRLDASAPPLRSDVPEGYGETGFVATGLTFPTVGCWKVVGRLGPASLTFVVEVSKVGRAGK
jgi:hypothetical protein